MKTEAGNRLGTEKIGKLMLELALPSVLAQIVNVLYNIVDRIYIGRKCPCRQIVYRGKFQINYKICMKGKTENYGYGNNKRNVQRNGN